METKGGVDPQIQKDIIERTQRNPGAISVLGELAKRGSEVYSSVVPNLGTGPAVYEKFVECGRNLDSLIEKFGK